MLMDAIRNDPAWAGGDYKNQPRQALRTAASLLSIAGSAPIVWQKEYPTRDAADKYVSEAIERTMATLDANDLLYQVDASRNYDPSPGLERIEARVTWINSADDFINPPELGIAEREAKRLKRGTFVLIPASESSRGHGTHTWAALWAVHLQRLLEESGRR
jgi:homoserine O-acetyltransferase